MESSTQAVELHGLDPEFRAFFEQHDANARWIRGVLSDPESPEDGRWGKAAARARLKQLRDKWASEKVEHAKHCIEMRGLRRRIVTLSVRVACGARHRRTSRPRPIRRRGSRRSAASTGSRGDPDDGEPEPPSAKPRRRRHYTGATS